MLDFGYYNMDCMDGMREFPHIRFYKIVNIFKLVHKIFISHEQ